MLAGENAEGLTSTSASNTVGRLDYLNFSGLALHFSGGPGSVVEGKVLGLDMNGAILGTDRTARLTATTG